MSEEDRLKEISKQISSLMQERQELAIEKAKKENQKLIGKIFKLKYTSYILERKYYFLFKAEGIDSVGNLKGTFLGKSDEFGHTGYIIINDGSVADVNNLVESSESVWGSWIGYIQQNTHEV